MAFDVTFDCPDWTDEGHFPVEERRNRKRVDCGNMESSYCQDHVCGWGWFSCGDGQCTDSIWTQVVCRNQRDIQYVRSILSLTSTVSITTSCWSFAICRLGFKNLFTSRERSACEISICDQKEFLFPAERPIAHPSVYLVYNANRSFEHSVTPDYICYNAFACQGVFQPTILKLNLSCNQWKEIMNYSEYTNQNWTNLVFHIRQTFFSCLLPKPKSVSNSLFNCGPVLISKHRLNDGHVDCANNEDERRSHDTCSLGATQRFQCSRNSDRCIPRTQLFDYIRDCSDGSDESKFYSCNAPDDYGCRWRRGTLQFSNYVDFSRLCDGFLDVQIGNETDELECPSIWKKTCNSTFNRCDFYWQCQNGHDELTCKYTIDLPPIHKECLKKNQFYCRNRTTGQLECYPPELSGDGHEHCIGAVDERVGGYCQSK
jgi:hypothetical protein